MAELITGAVIVMVSIIVGFVLGYVASNQEEK